MAQLSQRQVFTALDFSFVEKRERCGGKGGHHLTPSADKIQGQMPIIIFQVVFCCSPFIGEETAHTGSLSGQEPAKKVTTLGSEGPVWISSLDIGSVTCGCDRRSYRSNWENAGFMQSRCFRGSLPIRAQRAFWGGDSSVHVA